MKLFELLPALDNYGRVKRGSWDYFLVKPGFTNTPLIKLDLYSIQIERYALTYDDLLADDWELLNG